MTGRNIFLGLQLLPSEPPEEIDYVGVLREAFETSGWGQEVVVGEKNPESPEGQ